MFKKELFEKLGDEIYVYKNFLTQEECSILTKEADELPENVWKMIGEHGRYVSLVHLPYLKTVRDRLLSLLEPGSNLGLSQKSLKMTKNAWSPPHADNFEFLDVLSAASKYVEGEEFDLIENNCYGTVIYFNDFEGGALEYPEQGIVYKPNPGDLVIHSAGIHCSHAIQKIFSDVRYSYANHIYDFVKVPKGSIRRDVV